MFPIFRHALSRSRGQILGWGISLALLGVYVVAFYNTISSQKEQFEQLLKAYPPELMAFFGDMSAMFTPSGYLTVYFFSYMPLVLGIFAVLAGSGLVVSGEESGTLDLILAYPVSRTALFFGRALAFIVETVLIFAVVWLGFIIAMIWSDLNVGAGPLALPFLSLLGVILFFGGLALLLSLVLPSRRMGAMAAGLVLVASYFVTALSRLSPEESLLARLSPIKYYQGGEAISGLNWEWFIGLIGLGLIFTLLGWRRFERRDIRVGGEGGWQVSLPWRKAVQEGT